MDNVSANAIQIRSALSLWVAILETKPGSLAFPFEFNYACNELVDKGFRGDKVFLAGHGDGGRTHFYALSLLIYLMFSFSKSITEQKYYEIMGCGFREHTNFTFIPS